MTTHPVHKQNLQTNSILNKGRGMNALWFSFRLYRDQHDVWSVTRQNTSRRPSDSRSSFREYLTLRHLHDEHTTAGVEGCGVPATSEFPQLTYGIRRNLGCKAELLVALEDHRVWVCLQNLASLARNGTPPVRKGQAATHPNKGTVSGVRASFVRGKLQMQFHGLRGS